MHHSTGFSRDEIVGLCTMVRADYRESGTYSWRPVLGLYKSVVATLIYLRRNRVQAEIAEQFEVSQSTISRCVTALTPVLGRVLRDWVPVAEDLTVGTQYIVDGTLLPCWSWADQPHLYSGKHHTTGVNVQVACDVYGQLRWISDPAPGARHDSAALDASGVLDTLDPADWIGDRGYVGKHMLTPYKKPPGGALDDWQKTHNQTVNRVRYVIERTIAHLKNWNILHTDYRRPYTSFTETISTVIALHFYRLGE